jgi:diguanylate cyclase (GGDEF)-like protein
MSINKAEKRTVTVALLAMLSFAAMQLLHDVVIGFFEARTVLWFLSLLLYVNYAMCLAMVLLGWSFFVRSMTRHRIETAGLFAVVSLLDLLHAVTFYHMPFYREVGDTTLTMLLGSMAQLSGAVGLFIIFSSDDTKVPSAARRRTLIISVAAGVALIAALLIAVEYRSGALFAGESLQYLRTGAIVIILGGYAAAIASILYRNRAGRPQALLMIVQALVLLFFANLQVILSDHTLDIDLLLGNLFKLAGYFSLAKGIYLVTIDAPLRQQKRAEVQAQYMAYHDDLTGLGNRRLLADHLTGALHKAERANSRLAVMLLDVDRFKTINDTLGHSFGDMLLQAVADRLDRAIEQSGSVYRMGGDEFTIVLANIASPEEAGRRAGTVLQAFEQPIWMNGAEYHITVSIGISLYPEDGRSADQLIKHADAAMYNAKTDRNAYSLYKAEMGDLVSDRLRMETELRQALAEQQFRLDYQPLVQVDTGIVVGAEALLRWEHPTRGTIYPDAFIAITEENGMILELGEWVLRTACLQNRAWQDAGLPPISVSVNLSMRQFRQSDLVERVSRALQEADLAPDYLELEITESMTADVEYATVMLQKLKELGVRISIDDFGTGYSSLLYLKKFPIDKLKIDRSFVMDLLADGSDAAIVTTITSMARHMNLKVTAEGVENADQLAFLKERRCEEAQGYYFTRPISADAFMRWYEAHAAAV